METHMGKRCDICGDAGFHECMVTCDQCNVSCQHAYCMRHNDLITPETWFCEECCLSSHLVLETITEESKPNSPKVDSHENKESPVIKEEPIDQALCSSSLTTETQLCIDSCFSIQGDHRRWKGKKFSVPGNVSETQSSNPLAILEEAMVSQTDVGKTHKRVTFASQSVIISDDKFCSVAKSRISYFQERQPLFDLLHFEKYPSNRPNLEAVWNGSFEIRDMVSLGELYVGCRAHLPRIIDRKVYGFSKQMPEVLQFKLLPRSDIWAEIFPNDSALGYDISLYFFPGNYQGSLQQYVSLLGFMEMQDLVMSSCIDGVELLIFTSKQLRYAKELNWISFLWGIFRILKKENTVASPSGVRTFQDCLPISNVGAKVGRQLSESKTKSLDGLHVPAASRRFSGKVATNAVCDLSLLSSDLVEVPIMVHQWGAFHNVNDDKTAAIPSTAFLRG